MYSKVQEIVDPVYLVGGSVRDTILGTVPKDYDFTTPLSPDDVEARVRGAGKRPYLIGKRFGTIGFKIDSQMVEVTTFRSEEYDPGSRKPHVEFVESIEQDLSRRDFTINAIAMRGTRYIDPFGGRLDIMERLIKAVGLPKQRYKEDPLRMLRAARFAAQLGFKVDDLTASTAGKMSHKILEVSRERWMIELDKLLTSEYPEIGLEFLAQTRLLNFMIPELAHQVGYDQNSPWHELTLWEHTKEVVRLSPNTAETRWAALLHDIAKPYVRTENKKGHSNYIKHDLLGAEMVKRVALHLKWSTTRLNTVSDLVLNHLLDVSPLRAADNASKTIESAEKWNPAPTPERVK